MATLTVHDVPDDVVERIGAAAAVKGCSLEEEVRELIESHYGRTGWARDKQEALKRIQERWKDLPETTPEKIQRWLGRGPS